MRVGVTYDLRADYLARGHSEEDTAEFDSVETIDAICGALDALGYEPIRIGGIRELAAALTAGHRWDAVFNICEGLKGVSREAQVPALLEAWNIPYVFSDPLTLSLTLDKAMTKRVVRDADLPTAAFAVLESPADAGLLALPWPLFLKPVAEGSGKGVGAASRVANADEAARVAASLIARFDQPVLAETFLPGREFTIGITGTGDDAVILGIAEIEPRGNYVGHGYGFQNKENWEDKVRLLPAGDGEAMRAADIALAAWRVLRCRDGGRIDMRSDANCNPHFIEVNPLAGLRPRYSDLCFIADFAGITYNDLIGRFMDSFQRRHPHLRARAPRAAAE